MWTSTGVGLEGGGEIPKVDALGRRSWSLYQRQRIVAEVLALGVGCGSCACTRRCKSRPCSGGILRLRGGEVVTSSLECEPRRWKVVEHVREKFSCREYESITEPPAPSYPIGAGMRDRAWSP